MPARNFHKVIRDTFLLRSSYLNFHHRKSYPHNEFHKSTEHLASRIMKAYFANCMSKSLWLYALRSYLRQEVISVLECFPLFSIILNILLSLKNIFKYCTNISKYI